MVLLNCAIIEEGRASVVSIEIEESKTGTQLKKSIKKTKAIKDSAGDLQLYLAAQDDECSAWLLEKSSDDMRKLENGEKTALIEELISENKKLNAGNTLRYFLDDIDPPWTDEIHFLAVVVALDWSFELLEPHVYDSSLNYFMLEKKYLVDFGLPVLHAKFEFDFLAKNVLDNGHLSYILGPPGTGKSSTAAAFALTVNRELWVVTWIHVTDYEGFYCVGLVGNKRQCVLTSAEDLDKVLLLEEDTQHHLVLVDGWTEDCSLLTTKCMRWFLYPDTTMKRRLSFICSVASRYKNYKQEDLRSKALEFQVESWTLEEYISATEDDEFFSQVSPFLDVSPVNRAAVVASKYYHAGGCCRYMFTFSTADVKEKLLAAVSTLSGFLGSSSPVINRLFGMFRPPNGWLVQPVISRVLVRRCLNGWGLDLAFFASLRNDSVTTVDAAGNTMDKWPKANRIAVSDGVPTLSEDHAVWIKPEKWIQDGYDAIMVCKRTGHVRMVQVTSAQTCTFRIDLFSLWLEQFAGSKEAFKVQKLEIVFLVGRERLTDFKITEVYGEGMLTQFGWLNGKERKKITCAAMKRLF
ncbi:hypothetical protein P3T76_011846 [Phytophthora citrophthora]|uniref:Crinkler effector protein N-terminal domain-containing protein n=1 Tax=Phytophthora citrophthora TaxID=4793 RepID=A0AAD9G878_9STRA|nr:hypothetical protein P3T76_011846 [Phytophthora citrophthora]